MKRIIGPNMQEETGREEKFYNGIFGRLHSYTDGFAIYRFGVNNVIMNIDADEAVTRIKGLEKALGHEFEEIRVTAWSFPFHDGKIHPRHMPYPDLQKYPALDYATPETPKMKKFLEKFKVYHGPVDEVLRFIFGPAVDHVVESVGQQMLVAKELKQNPFSGIY